MKNIVQIFYGTPDSWFYAVIALVMTSIFYIVNESISILENAIRTGLPVPEKLKSIIRSLGKSEESSEISDEKEGK